MIRSLWLAAILVAPIATVGSIAGCSQSGSVGTSRTVSHTESDKKGWFGGKYHEANTVYQNSDGSTSVEIETTSTKNGTTTIFRERKTTNVDGSVKTDKETRTIVKGTDNTVIESKTTN
jgi:hypothetical protein